MDLTDAEKLATGEKLIRDYGLPIPQYCNYCGRKMGFYFKTGTGRWDGKYPIYCKECGEKMNKRSREPE